MSRSEHLGIGNLIQSLSIKVSDMQREIAGLRQDIKTITYLLNQLQSQNQDKSGSELDDIEENK